MKVLLTGAGGYIGTHVLRELLKKKNLSVRVMVHTDKDIKHVKETADGKRVEIIKGDITRRDDIGRAVKGCDTVIHLAAVVGVPDRKKNMKVNYEPVIELTKECRKNKVKQVIFTSSVSAIRKHKGPYGLSKMKAEKEIARSGIPYTIFRPTMVYGDRSQGLERIIQNIKRFPFFIPMVGTGRYLRQPIYVKDLARMIVLSTGNKRCVNKTYDAGGAENIAFRNLVKKTAKMMGVKKVIIPIPIWACKILGFVFEKTMRKPFFTREHIRSLSEDTKMNVKPIIDDMDFKFTKLDEGLKEAVKEMLLLEAAK